MRYHSQDSRCWNQIWIQDFLDTSICPRGSACWRS